MVRSISPVGAAPAQTAAVAALGWAVWLAAAQPGHAMQVFSANEYALRNGDAYPQFVQMVERYGREYRRVADDCPTHPEPICQTVAEWGALIEEARLLDRRAQLAAVNDYFNRYAYIDDADNWQLADYWETPLEFLARGGGDCEGFAVAKYYTLRALGFDGSILRIVVVMDYQRGMQHAVLAVAIDGEVLVLDNLADQVGLDRDFGHYQPLMSINELGIWVPI